ncbi:hypothetical protein T08_15517 [Trichinella sp. T8]|nr:hypothetical protein T08_15517 [Trichinella sp. T8]
MGHFYQPLIDSLQHITEWKDSSAASKAEQLRVAVCRGSFVLSLAVLNKVLALSLPLSKSLQDSCLEERSKEQHFLQKFYKSSTDGGYEGGDSRDGWSVTEFGPEMEVPGGEGGEEVQDREALERKCICGDHRKIVSVHQVDIFVELAREWEACQKIIRRPVLHKQAQKEKITNDMKIDLEFRHE